MDRRLCDDMEAVAGILSLWDRKRVINMSSIIQVRNSARLISAYQILTTMKRTTPHSKPRSYDSLVCLIFNYAHWMYRRRIRTQRRKGLVGHYYQSKATPRSVDPCQDHDTCPNDWIHLLTFPEVTWFVWFFPGICSCVKFCLDGCFWDQFGIRYSRDSAILKT
jgi:hypothetical protein